MSDKPTEALSFKITKAEKAALNRAAAKEMEKTGKKAPITSIVRRLVRAYLKRAA